MRTYEALYIVRPDITDEETQAVAKEVESLITGNGGSIVRSEVWGKRRLSYEVKHFNEGTYVLVRFESAPEFPKKLENAFRLNERVIRHLTVYFDKHTLRLEEEQQRRKREQIERASEAGEEDRDSDDRERTPHRSTAASRFRD